MLRIDCVSCQHRPVDTTVDITGTHVTYAQLVGKVCVDIMLCHRGFACNVGFVL